MWLPSFRKLGAGALDGNLEAGPEAEIMKECCLLSYIRLPFLYTAQTHLPKDGTTPVGNQETDPTDMPIRQSNRGNPFIETLFPGISRFVSSQQVDLTMTPAFMGPMFYRDSERE